MRYQETNLSVINSVNLGNTGRYLEARNALLDLSKLHPKNNYIMVNIASLCFVMQDLDHVEINLDQFMRNDEKTYPEFYQIASDLYIRSACFSKAIQCMQRVTNYFPDDESSWGMFAQTAFESRDPENAIYAVKKLLAINPANYEAKVLYANLLSSKGDFEHSESILMEVFKVAPWHSVACSVLSKCRKFSDDGTQALALFDKALKTDNPNETDDIDAEARIYYAKAKIFNDQQNYDQAWVEASRANAIRAKNTPFDQAEYSRFIDQIISQFSNIDYAANSSNSEKQPILIVGMPRSGTTLTEQILSLDDSIYPGGEKRGLDYALLMAFKGNDYLQGIGSANREQTIELATRYYRYFSAFSNYKGDRIVNKVPANYLHLGIFKLMFPKIKIINMQRNPLDVSVSIFFEHFSEMLNYTNDMSDIILVYKEYRKIMDFWKTQFADDILDINYQDLTENYEENKQKIIDFCGLKIDLDSQHENAKNLVETPSVWQVRQGIYKSSVERWKRYEKQLKEFTYILDQT